MDILEVEILKNKEPIWYDSNYKGINARTKDKIKFLNINLVWFSKINYKSYLINKIITNAKIEKLDYKWCLEMFIDKKIDKGTSKQVLQFLERNIN